MVVVGAVDELDSSVFVLAVAGFEPMRDGELSETELSELERDENGAREGEEAACWCSFEGEGGISKYRLDAVA